MRHLVIDIGNTRLKAALFDGKKIRQQAVFDPPAFEGGAKWLAGLGPIDGGILSSVAADDGGESFRAAFRYDGPLRVFDRSVPLPFSVKYKTPQTLGLDRLAAVAGAGALLPGRDCLVVDAGTCVKYDLLTASGDHLGGNIAPGARMRLRAMHEQTARLPLAPMAWPEGGELGDSTEAALQNGALFGMLLEVRGAVAFFRKKMPGLSVILTGGDADFFYKKLKINGLRLEKELTLIGLDAILEFNIKR